MQNVTDLPGVRAAFPAETNPVTGTASSSVQQSGKTPVEPLLVPRETAEQEIKKRANPA
ncbi:hypothetical protein [Morganella psychrotolerans]|uniref:hypothetical protein n=1 Tax=Morganella psychrotolerans TaxID=368603 RepID=UPI000AB09B44|nr:hypothetical protein [Morganella psychrotolerans]